MTTSSTPLVIPTSLLAHGDSPPTVSPSAPRGTDDPSLTKSPSKSELKRRAKAARKEANRAVMQAQRKEKKRAQRQRKRQRLQVSEGGVKSRRRGEDLPIPSGIRIILDCQFHGKMVEKELWSCVHQFQSCYAANRSAPRSMHVICTSFGPKVQAAMDQHICGYQRWTTFDWVPEPFYSWDGRSTIDNPIPEEPAMSQPTGNMVYLTADSPNVLTTLVPGTTYIIGAIVDRNREKGLCLGEAERRGIPHARLPIGEYVKLTQRRVLAINHVFEIMLAYLASQLREGESTTPEGDWKEAFLKVIPQRKLAATGTEGEEGAPPNATDDTSISSSVQDGSVTNT